MPVETSAQAEKMEGQLIKQMMAMFAEMKKEMGAGMEKMDGKMEKMAEKMDARNEEMGRSMYCFDEDQRCLQDSTRAEDENEDCLLRPPHEIRQ